MLPRSMLLTCCAFEWAIGNIFGMAIGNVLVVVGLACRVVSALLLIANNL